LVVQALRDLLAEGAGEDDDFDTEVMQADQGSPEDWLGSVGTAPFLAERRTLVVRNLLRLDPDKAFKEKSGAKSHPFAARLKALPATARLVLVGDSESGDYAKQKTLGDVGGRWEKIVKAGGGQVLRFDPDPRRASERIKAEAERRGLKVSPKVALLLGEMVGGQVGMALQELEKLALYIHPDKKVEESHVRSLVTATPEFNVFSMIDAIVEGRPAQAAAALQVVLYSGPRGAEESAPLIMRLLIRRFTHLWEARICQEHRVSPAALPDEVARLMGAKPNITSLPAWQADRLLPHARRLGFDRLTAAMEEILRADCRLKGILPGFSPADTLEEMTIRLAGLCQGRN
ncbi:MAG: DNA polymerase III subunit delta, partial [Fimbriimonadaceae bacterium]|nr:DNA polymerase III subunit delta [Fimbriimonadaceae bacterium]